MHNKTEMIVRGKSGKSLAAGARDFFRRARRHWQWYILILLPLANLLIFSYGPMFGAQIAFRDFKPRAGITGSEWVGFKHFIEFFKSYNFETVITNTLALSLYSLIASFPIPIILAILLNEVPSVRFRKVVQLATYAPYFISTVVLVSMLTQFLSPRIGFINNLIVRLGGDAKNYMSEPGLFRHLYVWSGVWQSAGYSTVMYIAALTSVDPALYEAARVDGASRWQKVLHIDLPMLLPTATILLILNCGSIMSLGFEKAYLMQNSMNITQSEIISTYVYKLGMERADFSYSTAIDLFNAVINMLLLLFVNRVARRAGGTSLW